MSDSTVGLAELLRPVRGRLALAVGLQVVAGLAGIVPFRLRRTLRQAPCTERVMGGYFK